jgi:hypothetical protein
MTEVAVLPSIAGEEAALAAALERPGPHYLPESDIDWGHVRSGFACALHMHQPLIPAGGDDMRTAKVISNLKYMLEHVSEGDNHNAPVFHWCYRRMGEFIPDLVSSGKKPRIMLDYSGCLLHGLADMGLSDVFDALRTITCDTRYRRSVEHLGTAWGHAVAPSTPSQDFRYHVRAWQHHFAAIFGHEAVSRVRGFSPPEMALPNHPDVFFEFVKTLRDCGYRWVLVQEHTVERPEDGGPAAKPHLPHRLVARSSRGETLTIQALVKAQGSDTKLVGQMQPYYEAKGLSRIELGGTRLPPLVSQIADGENGGVMMNEFPPKYFDVMNESSHSEVPALNGTEYLEHLDSLGLQESDFPPLQPRLQHRLWQRFEPGAGPEKLARAIEQLTREDSRFHMEGGSWTNDISWVRGYQNVLGPMESVSALFAEKAADTDTRSPRYRNALFHLLITQTSCFRYWGGGRWTDYGRELCRRAQEILAHDF